MFSLLGMWRNELGNLISVPQESMQKRFVWIEIEILKEVDGHCMSAPTTQPSSFFPNPFFPNPNLKNHSSELC